MPHPAVTSGTIQIHGHNGDQIEAYMAKPPGDGPFPGVVLIHHMPGWDEWCCEATRKLAHHGYAAIAPHLFSRFGPGQPDDIAAKARAAGGVGDEQVMGDVKGAADFLRTQSFSTGKMGVIGFCSGGRQTYLAACLLDFDAAVDCWGGGVIPDPNAATPAPGALVRMSPIEQTDKMQAPLLGIFGNDDRNPDPEQVNNTEAELKRLGKTYEFHRYDGAGHGFFAVDRPGYRSEQATDAWTKVFAWYEKHLGAPSPVLEPAAAR
ncbi:MAG: prolyl oligopeptidase family serine peptidase [Dehalococcoidia bacterium]|nr:prolyl oligopeptidase family serine peptidase [Dehalococcoidia bacterium]